MSCVYFNKQLYSEYFGDPDDMYKTVLDGKWTLDKLSDMAKGMYKDLNGNGRSDIEDQFGIFPNFSADVERLMYGAGLRTTARDEEWLPYFISDKEKLAAFNDKIFNLYYRNEGVRISTFEEAWDRLTVRKFANDEVLFLLGGLGHAEEIRDMETDYGIIPTPKFDENEPGYLSVAHDGAPIYSVPATLASNKYNAVGAVLELMAYESYYDVLPAFFEIALKMKYARDESEDAFNIIDMIHANSTTDFAYIYNYALHNIGLLMRDMMQRRSTNIISNYERTEPRAQASLEELIDVYFQ